MKKVLLSVLASFLICSSALASQEGVLALQDFKIETRGIGESGPVIVTGKQDEKNQVTALKVEAFGKAFELKAADLEKIPKFPYNGIQLSFETGYKELGGRTIYVNLQFGFTSGNKQRVLITIPENAAIKVEPLK